jgi:predicted NBD/HSP70 family sugar kinase
MSEGLVALGDIGASQTRLVVKDTDGLTVGELYAPTNVADYEGSLTSWVDGWQAMADGKPIIAAAIAIAAAVNPRNGELVKAGDLTPWVGCRPAARLTTILGRETGILNDVEAIAESQLYINRRNGLWVSGIANTLSSGWGATRYDSNEVMPDEPGHEYLRDGAVCPCGEQGHAEAWISGNGKFHNTNMPMEDWLKLPGNYEELATDVSQAVVDMLHRHKQLDGFWPDELRWTGGVALNQPFLMRSVHDRVVQQLELSAEDTPAFDTVTMMGQAGIHGAYIRALELAAAS